MSYVPAMGAYLVIGGPTSREPADFGLWRWSGEPGAAAIRLRAPGLRSLEKAEGVSPAVIGGAARIIIVSDDGNRKAGRFAGYVLLDPGQLRTAG